MAAHRQLRRQRLTIHQFSQRIRFAAGGMPSAMPSLEGRRAPGEVNVMGAPAKVLIVDPQSRSGSTTEVVQRGPTLKSVKGDKRRDKERTVTKTLRSLTGDVHLTYLTERAQNYTDLTMARLESLKAAIERDDQNATEDIARSLADSTAKLGAIRAMKLCIALQMLGRRGLLQKCKDLSAELEVEFGTFKQNLITAV
jgi:hypothetical protein